MDVWWTLNSFCCIGFSTNFDHSQVDFDYHQSILARWVFLLTVLPWCYCPGDQSHWWLASAGPQIQCCTWCLFSRLNCIQKRVQSFGRKKFISHMMGSLGRFSNLWFSCVTHPQHAWTIAVDQKWQSIVWQSWFESKLWQKQSFRFFDGHLAESKSHLLWRIERSLHEEDPGHHRGEHFNLALFNSIKYSFN